MVKVRGAYYCLKCDFIFYLAYLIINFILGYSFHKAFLNLQYIYTSSIFLGQVNNILYSKMGKFCNQFTLSLCIVFDFLIIQSVFFQP